MNVAYICTNYNNAHFSEAAVASWLGARRPAGIGNCRAVVVDNDSAPTDVQRLKEFHGRTPGMELVCSPANLGYFGGLNAGLEHLHRADAPADLVVIGNNDLIFPAGFLESLWNCRDRFADHAVVSPDIVTLDGAHQNPHVISGIGWKRQLVYDIYHSSYLCARAIRRLAHLTRRFTDRHDESEWEKPQLVHQGHGSCYILGPLFFKNFTNLWAPTFLLGEEFFLSKQLSDRGMMVYYEPAMQITHHCNATIGRMPGRLMWRYSREAHRIYRQHVTVFGRTPGAGR